MKKKIIAHKDTAKAAVRELLAYTKSPHIAQIKESLETPQQSPYHSEGNKLEDHLNEMVLRWKQIISGTFKDAPEALVEILKRPENQQTIEDFILFHDIAKKDTIGFKFPKDVEKMKFLESKTTGVDLASLISRTLDSYKASEKKPNEILVAISTKLINLLSNQSTVSTTLALLKDLEISIQNIGHDQKSATFLKEKGICKENDDLYKAVLYHMHFLKFNEGTTNIPKPIEKEIKDALARDDMEMISKIKLFAALSVLDNLGAKKEPQAGETTETIIGKKLEQWNNFENYLESQGKGIKEEKNNAAEKTENPNLNPENIKEILRKKDILIDETLEKNLPSILGFLRKNPSITNYRNIMGRNIKVTDDVLKIIIDIIAGK